jgi:hypothetical protein
VRELAMRERAMRGMAGHFREEASQGAETRCCLSTSSRPCGSVVLVQLSESTDYTDRSVPDARGFRLKNGGEGFDCGTFSWAIPIRPCRPFMVRFTSS